MSMTGQKAQHGQVTVEFALVFSFFVFFMLSLINFGLAIHNYITVTHAIHEGAQVAARGGTDAEIKEAVLKHIVSGYVETPLMKGRIDGVYIYPEEAARSQGEAVTVGIEYNVGLAVGFLPYDAMTIKFPISSSHYVEYDDVGATMSSSIGGTSSWT